jgi:acetyltransferase
MKQKKQECRIAEIRLQYSLIRLRPIAVARLVFGASEAIFREGMHMGTAAVDGRRLEDRAEVVIRAVNADDAPRLQAFVRGLSVRSRRYRFFSALVELSASQLDRLVRPDRIGLALVALSARSKDAAVVGEARYVVDPAADCEAEFAIAIADGFQRKGLGTRLMKMIVAHASKTGVRRLFGEILAENRAMLAFMRQLGFGVRANVADHRTMVAGISIERSAT